MLRNKLVPEAEIEEANELYAYKKRFAVDAQDRFTLIGNGFDKVLYKKLFIEPDRAYYKFWDRINQDSTGYREYIEFLPIDKTIVEFVSTELSKEFTPYYLIGTLEHLFQNNPVKKQEFKNIATTENITIPSNLPSLA